MVLKYLLNWDSFKNNFLDYFSKNIFKIYYKIFNVIILLLINVIINIDLKYVIMKDSQTKIQLSPKYKNYLEKCDSLKTELSKLITERDHLEETVKKNFEALYIIKVGKNEYELFKSECEVSRLKRKFELIQIKINHGKKVDIENIDKKLNAEYRKWEQKIEKMMSKIDLSKRRLKSLMTDKESKKLHNLYRQLVKKLHPDINLNQLKKEKILWNRTVDSYSIGDIEELETIKMLTEDIGKEDISKDPLQTLNKKIKSYKDKIIQVMQYIQKLKSEFPFTIQDKINDSKSVEGKNKETLLKIKNLNEKRKELLKIISNLLMTNIEINKTKHT